MKKRNRHASTGPLLSLGPRREKPGRAGGNPNQQALREGRDEREQRGNINNNNLGDNMATLGGIQDPHASRHLS